MANIPGAVTDPGRVRGETIDIQERRRHDQGLSRPAEPGGRYPGIVVIHEAFGLVEHIRDIARRFANIGYNAIAPDLYTRKGGPSGPERHQHGVPGHVRPARLAGGAGPRSLGRPSPRPLRRDRQGREPSASARAAGKPCCSPAAATRSMLRSIAGAGSSTAPLPTPRPPRRGRRPSSTWWTACIARSSRCSARRTRTRPWRNPRSCAAAPSAPARTSTIKVYKDAGHAFLADYRPSYREGPAAELWRDAVAFFDKHLKS